MKYLAISDFKEWELAEELALTFDLGFESQFYTKNEHLSPLYDSKPPTLADEISRISFHGPFRGLDHLSDDEDMVVKTLEYYNRFYSVAKEQNACHVVFHSGYHEDISYDNWLRKSYQFWSSFFKDKGEDLEIHIENVYESEVTPLAELIDMLDRKHVKICLDMGHTNMSSVLGINHWITTLGSRIGSLHIHNNDSLGDQHKGITNGSMDMNKALSLCEELTPESVWVLETREKRASLEWLIEKNLFTSLGK